MWGESVGVGGGELGQAALDEHTTRDDPAHDTELEAAQHKIAHLNRALQNEMTARTVVLQCVARSVRNAYQQGYNAGRQQANS